MGDTSEMMLEGTLCCQCGIFIDDSVSGYARYCDDCAPDPRRDSQRKRANNRMSSAERLREAGIEFEAKNKEAHLIVSHKGEIIDFWPGTGLWIVRNDGFRKRGVFKLIKYLRGSKR